MNVFCIVVEDGRLVEASGTTTDGDLVIGSDASIDVVAAYRRWGAACVDHLDGDFSFAIWDASRRTLFAARDPFGARPLFRTSVGGATIVANQINAIRETGRVSDTLDQLAIARFLAGGTEADPIETVFAEIQRVPPASMLVDGEIRTYWSVGVPRNLGSSGSLGSLEDPVRRFTEIFDAAVAKRAREDTIAVLMSGGLDSTSVAVSGRIAGKRVHAYTLRGADDEEASYAEDVARAWGMEHHIIDRADYPPFAGWDAIDRDEPYDDPFAAPFLAATSDAAKHTGTMLTGHGGDALLYATRNYFLDLLRRGRVVRIARDVAAHVTRTGALPPLGFRGALRRRVGMAPAAPQLPPWLRRDLREQLEAEFREERATTHPIRPDAQRAMTIPDWSLLFEVFHPAQTGLPITFAYPFFDRPLVELVFSLPPLPWFAGKYLLRRAMRERLPARVVRRPKAALPRRKVFDDEGVLAERLIAIVEGEPALGRFIENAVLFEALRRGGVGVFSNHVLLLPVCLALWLGRLQRPDDGKAEKAVPDAEAANLR